MAAHLKHPRPENETPQSRGRITRMRMTGEWNKVLDMLEKGRKDAAGRTLTEVWADMVLADPGAEFARVSTLLLPKEIPQSEQGVNVITSIQSLYLTAVQKAQEPKAIEHKGDDDESSSW